MTLKHLPFLLVLALPILPACASPAVELEGRYWFPDFALEARIEDEGVGTKIDFDKDLGMDDENFAGGRFRWFTGDDSWIRIDYVPLSWDGDENLTRTVQFNGQTYTAGTRVASEFEMDYARLGWGWQFIDLGDVFKLGTLLEIKAFDLNASLDSALIQESEDLVFALPTAGLILDINPMDSINLYGEASGIKAGKYGYMFDAEAGLRFIPLKNVTLTAGYRIIRFDVDVSDNMADLKLHGPFIGGSIRF